MTNQAFQVGPNHDMSDKKPIIQGVPARMPPRNLTAGDGDYGGGAPLLLAGCSSEWRILWTRRRDGGARGACSGLTSDPTNWLLSCILFQ